MKVTLFVAQTINGFIARENYEEDFLSETSWKTFVKLAEETGCFITSSKTYELYTDIKSKEYSFDKIGSKKIIVSSRNFESRKDYYFVKSPDEALKVASKLGFDNVLLCSGGGLNSSFIKSNLIDEILINIEPYILGNGIKIFSSGDFENKLELIKSKKLESGVIQLHYKIKKRKKK